MIKKVQSPHKRPRKKGGKLIPALCNVLGTLILLVVIAACIPMAIPELLGCSVYTIVSGSMEPEIPVGSLVIARPVDPESVVEQDVIAFDDDGVVITHRVVENKLVEGEFITKGDANAGNDMEAVPYDSLIGKIVFDVPMLGNMLFIFSSRIGKVYVLCFAACGVMFNMLASRLRERQ
ncbi:MAG: signal peptidase I [Eubacteriales bacterium]|nr:signal peptidase I [Eubacteriales bacterium]